MDKIIDDLYEAQADKGDFQSLDKIITEEANERLSNFKETMSLLEFEKVRDAVFSAAAISKRAAFEIGFKTAMRLVLECRDSK